MATQMPRTASAISAHFTAHNALWLNVDMKRLALSALIILVPALMRADEKETMLQALGQYEQAWRSTPPCELTSNACQTRETFLLQQAAQAADRYLAARPPATSRIAVMPFANLSPDKNDAIFADGIYDGFSTQLAKLADLNVISHDSVAKYRDERATQEIGRALNVAYVLKAGVRREAGRIRVNVQLYDAHTDAHVWAQDYDQDDPFALQSEIAQNVAEQLGSSWSSLAQSVIRFSQVRSDAYAKYIQVRNDPAAEKAYHSVVDPVEAEFLSRLKGTLRCDASREIAERFGLVDF